MNKTDKLTQQKSVMIGLAVLLLTIYISGVFFNKEGSLGIEKFLSGVLYFKAIETDGNTKFILYFCSFICALF